MSIAKQETSVPSFERGGPLGLPGRSLRDVSLRLDPGSLGSASFRREYKLKYAYCAGSMYKGVGSKELVVAMGRRGMMGFLGTGGLRPEQVEESIRYIKAALSEGQSYGMNLLADPMRPDQEDRVVDLYLREQIRTVEASAFMQVSQSLVRYRLSGLTRNPAGDVEIQNRIIAKVSRPEVATVFMQPAPTQIVEKLVAAGQLTPQEAELGRKIPLAHDICVEADSGGHTDQGVAYALMPAMIALRNRIMTEHAYREPIRIGAAGGIGTPDAAAAAFVLGADFIVTGSINQCTVEAGTSDAVKDLLQQINVQDTTYAPAGDMFEMGARVQVLKKGLLFPVRANKLYEIYQRFGSLDEIDEKTRTQIQEKYFKRTFDEVWREVKEHYAGAHPAALAAAERSAKQKMALVFRWYFVHTTRLALSGSPLVSDYQVHCGPALGAFNQWVLGTGMEDWRQRRVADIAEAIMEGAAEVLASRMANILHMS
nr:PfaD family polyunsaturated fatty acid/polyketide biosynthesis protein [Variovorax sp. YR750]